MSTPQDRKELFWSVAASLLADPEVTPSTMMGYPCLRANGAFFASIAPTTGHLIVKLPEARVAELIASSDAAPFAPAGRVFREWAAIQRADPGEWHQLLREARAFATASAAPAQDHKRAPERRD